LVVCWLARACGMCSSSYFRVRLSGMPQAPGGAKKLLPSIKGQIHYTNPLVMAQSALKVYLNLRVEFIRPRKVQESSRPRCENRKLEWNLAEYRRTGLIRQIFILVVGVSFLVFMCSSCPSRCRGSQGWTQRGALLLFPSLLNELKDAL